MSQDYSPSLVTKNLVFCGDAAMKSAAGPATLLYDKVNNNNGTMYNGTCLDFDGTDDTVSFGYSSDYIMNGPCTIVVIFTGDGNLTGSTDWRDTIFSNDQSNSFGLEIGAFNGCGIGDTDGFRFLIHRQGHCFSAVSEANAYTRYAVTFFAYTRDSSNAEKMYVDGQEISMQQNNAYTFSAGSSTSYIGTRGTNLGQDLDGQVHDLKIFSKELSAANIKELYDDSKVIIPTKNDASGGFVSQTDLKLWVPLSEGAGSVAYDGSGKGRDGTIANASWLTGQTGAPQLVQGYNRPLLGDGAVDLYVTCGDPSSDVDIGTGDFALGYWINPRTITGSYIGHVTYTAGDASARFEVAFLSSRIHVYTTNSTWNDTGYSPSLKTWTHILFKRESNSITMHVNGSSSATWTLSSSVTLGPCTKLQMTNHSTGSFASLDGLLNEVVLYVGTSLTNAQMAALAATGPNGGPLPPNPASGPSSLPSTSYLKGYWRNDSDVTWTDLSGSGNDGTVTNSNGTILFKQGYNGQKNVNTGRDGQGFPLKFKDVGAVGYKGSNYISVPHSSVFDNTAFSFCSWVYVPGDTTTDGKVAHLSRNSSGNGWAVWQLRTVNGATNEVKYQTNNGGTWQTQTYSNFFSGAGWYYVCVTHIQGNAAKLYRNGIEVSGSGYCTQDFEFGIDPLYIGARKSASTMLEFWDGQIANSQYYNRALSYAEIQQNYKAQRSRFT